MQLHRNKSYTTVIKDYQEINRKQQNTDVPFLCYFCGFNDTSGLDLENTPHKQKVNLSKINKPQHNTNMKASVSSNERIQLAQSYRKIPFTQQPNPRQIHPDRKVLKPELQPLNYYNIRTSNPANYPQSNTTNYSRLKNEQPVENYNIRFSYNRETQNKMKNQAITYSAGQIQKNTHFKTDSLRAQEYNKASTDISKFQLPQQYYKQNPRVVLQNNRKTQNNDKLYDNVTIFNQKNKNWQNILKPCTSKQQIKIVYHKQQQNQGGERISINTPKNNPSTQSTQEQISPPFTNFKPTVSIQQPSQLKLNHKKKKSSRSNKAPRFLKSLKKVSSNQNEISNKSLKMEKNDSNITQFGRKIKIGIRKVESFESSSSDEYSEVISQGGRSFLMPEINQLQQMSRMSSRSSFKNWEDDQQLQKNQRK